MAHRGHRFLTDPLLRNPVLLGSAALYVLFRLLLWQFPQLLPLSVIHYLPDVLCLPLLLSLAVLLQRHLILRQPSYQLNKWQVLFAWAYISVLFELVFPHFLPRYTADVWDVLAYGVGGLVYWKWVNPTPALPQVGGR